MPKAPPAGAVSRTPAQAQVQDRPSVPDINAMDRRRSRRRDQDTRSWEEGLTPMEAQRLREVRDREKIFLQEEQAKEAARNVAPVPSVPPTVQAKVAGSGVQKDLSSDKATAEIKTPAHLPAAAPKVATVTPNPAPGGRTTKAGGLPPPLPPSPGAMPSQAQKAPASVGLQSPSVQGRFAAPPAVAEKAGGQARGVLKAKAGGLPPPLPSSPGVMAVQAPAPVSSKSAEVEQQLAAVLREGFAEHADEIAKFALRKFPEIIRDQRASGQTKKDYAFVKRNQYILKYRFREGNPELVVGKDVGEGTFKVVKKVYSISVRTLQLKEAVAYAKFKEKSSMSTEEVKTEVAFSKRIKAGLSPGEIPKFVQVHEVFKIKRPAVMKGLMMELCSGDTIGVTQNPSKFSLKDRLILARDEAEGIAQMHRSKVIHSDLKPANILFKKLPDGYRALISDFGTCRIAGTEIDIDSGSILYMAPERLKTRKIRAKESQDLWALGFCIFELIYGEDANPFFELQRENFLPPSVRWQGAYKKLMNKLAGPEPINVLLRSLFDMKPEKRLGATAVKAGLDSILAMM